MADTKMYYQVLPVKQKEICLFLCVYVFVKDCKHRVIRWWSACKVWCCFWFPAVQTRRRYPAKRRQELHGFGPSDILQMSPGHWKKIEFLFLIAIETCAILTPLHRGLYPKSLGCRDYQKCYKKHAQKIKTIFM